MSAACPCCGAPLPDGVVPAERLASVLRCGRKFRLIVSLLASRPGVVFASQSIASWLYAEDPNGGPEHANACVHSAIRTYKSRLEPLGWRICSKTGEGNGFWLEVAT